jgi:hypothetical protein
MTVVLRQYLCGKVVACSRYGYSLEAGGWERRTGRVLGVGDLSARPARSAVATAGVLWPHDKQRHYAIWEWLVIRGQCWDGNGARDGCRGQGAGEDVRSARTQRGCDHWRAMAA